MGHDMLKTIIGGIIATVVGGIILALLLNNEPAAPPTERAAATAPIAPPQSAVARRLLHDEVVRLVSGKLERGTLIKPTRAAVEGNPKTSYNAYYYADQRMLYKRDASLKVEQWRWRVDDNGNLCRGPVSAPKLQCRAIETLGGGHYRGVGFRTGKTRYEFLIRQGRPEDLDARRR